MTTLGKITRRQFVLRNVRVAFRSALCSLLAVLIALGPIRPVLGSVDTAAPAESFSFGDTTPATQPAIQVAARVADKAADVAKGAKNLAEAVGKDSVALVNEVLKGKRPLTDLSSEQRQAAADFYRATAQNTVGNLREAASKFSQLRADFLEGKTQEVPGNINDFISRHNLPKE